MIVELQPNSFLRLRAARGARINVLRGRVWITEEGVFGDHLIGEDRYYDVESDGLVVVGSEASPISTCAEIVIDGSSPAVK